MNRALIVCCTALLTVAGVNGAQAFVIDEGDSLTIPAEWMNVFQWRSIGPANMSGRIVAFAVNESDPFNYWVATASGGLLKTTNAGVTYEHQFDDQNTVSIGHVAVARSNPDILWVGTGEANPRNSVSYGDGVYKSTDGGETWEHKGLSESFQIGRIAIHHENPDIVYVGALGRLWGTNEERGLYKTTDGGDTWERVLYIDDKTGIIDVDMNPNEPDTLIVATYERMRDGTDANDPIKKWGEGSGLYKTTDGGETWVELTEGLPSVKKGRIGVDYFRSDPNIVFAVVESERIQKIAEDTAFLGASFEDADVGVRLTEVAEDGPAASSGLKVGDFVLAFGNDPVRDSENLTKMIRNRRAGEAVTVQYVRDREFQTLELTFGERADDDPIRELAGGLGGQNENRQDLQGYAGHESGGIYKSEDGGNTWTRINSLNPRPMYYSQIRVDPSDAKYVYVLGTALYRSSDGGVTFSDDGGRGGVHVDHHAMWIDPADGRHIRLGNDGGIYVTHDRMENWDHHNHVAIGQFYHATVGPRALYNVYGGLQDNGSWGGPSRTRTSTGPVNTDWISIGGGDGFICLVDPNDPDQIYFESQNGGMGSINLRTGERGFIRPQRVNGERPRFNWKTPFHLSHHNSRIFYAAGNYVFRSLHKGENMQAISPDLTNTEDGAGSAFGESPRDSNVLYAGTTDGGLWRTRDAGVTWTNLFTGETVATAEARSAEQDEPSGEGARAGGRQRAALINRMIEQFDGNEDGKLEKSEVPESAQGIFERFDRNGDGVIDAGDAGEQETAPDTDPITGTWRATLTGEGIPAGAESFELTLELGENDAVSGSFTAAQLSGTSSSGSFDRANNILKLTFDAAEGVITLTATLETGNAMNGTIDVGNGLFTVSFRAVRGEQEDVAVAPTAAPQAADVEEPQAAAEAADAPAEGAHVLQGKWQGELIGDMVPPGAAFGMDLKVSDDGTVTGQVTSDQGDVDIEPGTFDPSTGKFSFTIDIQGMAEGAVTGTVKGDDATGSIAISTDQFDVEIEFKASRIDGDTTRFDPHIVYSFSPGVAPRNPWALPVLIADPVSGTWACEMVSDQGGFEFSLVLKLEDGNTVSGEFRSQFSDAKIDKGSFDPETGRLSIEFSTQMGDATIQGTIADKKFTGELVGGGGQFTVDVSGTQTESTAPPETEQEAEGEGEGDTQAQAEADTAASSGEESQPRPIGEIVPKPMWVSAIEPSRYEDGRVYITIDGHRYDNDDPWILVSEDYGDTWTSLGATLPRGSTRVVREDIANENVLYLGTEFGAWVSIDRGKSWRAFNEGNLPTVAVHEMSQHPTRGEMLAATHGRSLWIGDVSALRQITSEVLSADAWLFAPADAYAWRSLPSRGASGLRVFEGSNGPSGATLYYTLADDVESLSLSIRDIRGDVIRELAAPGNAGLHRVNWDLRRVSSNQGGRRGRGAPVDTGKYLVVLTVNGEEHTQVLTVHADPEYPATDNPFVEEELDGFWDEENDTADDETSTLVHD